MCDDACYAREMRSLTIKQTLMPLRRTEFWEGEAVQQVAKASERRDASQTYRRCLECAVLAAGAACELPCELQECQRGAEKSRV